MICLKSSSNYSKIKYVIVLIKQRTRHFILMADVTIKNVGLLKNSCSLPAYLQHAGDLLQTNPLRRQQVYSKSV
jgi:hypothetical protein